MAEIKKLHLKYIIMVKNVASKRRNLACLKICFVSWEYGEQNKSDTDHTHKIVDPNSQNRLNLGSSFSNLINGIIDKTLFPTRKN